MDGAIGGEGVEVFVPVSRPGSAGRLWVVTQVVCRLWCQVKSNWLGLAGRSSCRDDDLAAGAPCPAALISYSSCLNAVHALLARLAVGHSPTSRSARRCFEARDWVVPSFLAISLARP